MTPLLIFIALLLLAVVVRGWGYFREDTRDETIGVDQFRRERAAIIELLQRDAKARVIQMKGRVH